MLVIRLQRRGKKNQPFFKIIVTDKRNAPIAGVSVEEIGYVNPLTKEKSVDKERASHWLSKGAKPSETVYNILVEEGVIKEEKKKIKIKTVKNPEKKAAQRQVKEAPKVEEKPAETEVQVEQVEENKEAV